MTFAAHPLAYVLWIVIMIAQGCVLALLVGRRGYREYPAFTAFIVFCVIHSLVLFYLSNYAPGYYLPVYWLTYVPELVILASLVQEMFYVLFHPYETLPANTLRHFLGAILAVAILILTLTAIFPGAQPKTWLTVARATDQAVTWLLCVIFTLIVLFAKYFGIPWRHRLQGIASGFLIFLSVDIFVTTIVTQLHLPPYSAVWSLGMFAFLAACCTWAYYFAAEDVARTVPSLEELRKAQLALQRVAGALSRFSGWENRTARKSSPREGVARAQAR